MSIIIVCDNCGEEQPCSTDTLRRAQGSSTSTWAGSLMYSLLADSTQCRHCTEAGRVAGEAAIKARRALKAKR